MLSRINVFWFFLLQKLYKVYNGSVLSKCSRDFKTIYDNF